MNLVRSLVVHGEVTTTRAKARELKRLTDKMVAKAAQDSVSTRRQLHRFFGKRDVVNTLVEKIAPKLKGRSSGFTTTTTMGVRRGDKTPLIKVSFVEKIESLGTLKSGAKHPAKKKAVAAASTAKKSTEKKTTKTKLAATSKKKVASTTKKSASSTKKVAKK